MTLSFPAIVILCLPVILCAGLLWELGRASGNWVAKRLLILWDPEEILKRRIAEGAAARAEVTRQFHFREKFQPATRKEYALHCVDGPCADRVEFRILEPGQEVFLNIIGDGEHAGKTFVYEPEGVEVIEGRPPHLPPQIAMKFVIEHPTGKTHE